MDQDSLIKKYSGALERASWFLVIFGMLSESKSEIWYYSTIDCIDMYKNLHCAQINDIFPLMFSSKHRLCVSVVQHSFGILGSIQRFQ